MSVGTQVKIPDIGPLATVVQSGRNDEESDEDDVLSADLADEMADTLAEIEANVIGGNESSDRTGCHPKIIFDAQGKPVGIEKPKPGAEKPAHPNDPDER